MGTVPARTNPLNPAAAKFAEGAGCCGPVSLVPLQLFGSDELGNVGGVIGPDALREPPQPASWSAASTSPARAAERMALQAISLAKELGPPIRLRELRKVRSSKEVFQTVCELRTRSIGR